MRDNYWEGLAGGIAVIAYGILIILGDGAHYKGFPVLAWTGWVLIPIGIIITVSFIRALWLSRENKSPYSEQDVERAKATLTRMYMQDHGTSPKEETPKEDAPRYKKTSRSWYWWGIVLGVALFAWGIRIIQTSGGNYLRPSFLERVSVPFVCVGIFLTAASIRALWLGRKEAARAKAALTAVPLPKHRSPLKEKTPGEAPKDDAPRSKRIAKICCWLSIVFGVLAFACGMWMLHTDDGGSDWHPSLPGKTPGAFISLGIFIIAASIRALWLGRRKKPLYSGQNVE